MEVYNLGENNSLLNKFIYEIRNKEIQNDPLRFRRNLERIGEVFAYEISKKLPYKSTKLETPLAAMEMNVFESQPVLATILRAGLPLHIGLLNYFDRAENTFISAYRRYTEKNDFIIEFEYMASPNLDDKVVILTDPMLATGASMEISYQALFKMGNPKHVHIVSIISSQQGVDYLKEKLEGHHCTLWLGAIDPDLTPKSYIVPGLGDAGDLAFGDKLDF